MTKTIVADCLFCVLCFLLIQLLILVNGKDTRIPLPSRIVRARIQDQQQSKQQSQQQQQLWLYEGGLYDPLDGKQIAKVQGLELARPVTDTTDLAIDAILRHPNASYEDAQTVWSQKIFCYTKTAAANNDNSDSNNKNNNNYYNKYNDLLRSVRLRRQSPKKYVPLNQAVAVYETATTFISRNRSRDRKNNNNYSDDDSDDEDVDLLIHSEFPNGLTIWGETQELRQQQQNNNDNTNTNTNANSETIDFTIFAKLRSKRSLLFTPDLTIKEIAIENTKKDKKNRNDSNDVIVQPKRSALIQFGSSSGTMESKHKFGARETYSYRNMIPYFDTNKKRSNTWYSFPWKSNIQSFLNFNIKKDRVNNSNAGGSIYYTRYGEGPPFYAPGRMCMLELKGRPIDDLKDATPLLQRLLQQKTKKDDSNDDDNNTGCCDGDGGPVVGFHYQYPSSSSSSSSSSLSAKETAQGSMTAERPSPLSIQSAWKLNNNNDNNKITSTSRHNYQSITTSGNNRGRFTTTASSSSAPKLLRLVTFDDESMNVHDNNNIVRTWTRQGKHRLITVWDRIRASTSLETTGN